MRQELELAKAELQLTATRAGKGAGMLGGAAIAGYFVLLFVSVALWWAIGAATGLGWVRRHRRGHLDHHRNRPRRHGPQISAIDSRAAENRGHREENPGRPQGQRITTPTLRNLIRQTLLMNEG
jgi:hypothetical protein